MLVGFSDGITEAMNAAGEPYGDERLLEALHAHSGTPAPALVETITRLVDEYAAGAPQADDMTLLIFSATTKHIVVIFAERGKRNT